MIECNFKSNSFKVILVDLVFEELVFLKYIDDFDEVSCFLEEYVSFFFNLGDFDVIW